VGGISAGLSYLAPTNERPECPKQNRDTRLPVIICIRRFSVVLILPI
jgi:hypothetical protein